MGLNDVTSAGIHIPRRSKRSAMEEFPKDENNDTSLCDNLTNTNMDRLSKIKEEEEHSQDSPSSFKKKDFADVCPAGSASAMGDETITENRLLKEAVDILVNTLKLSRDLSEELIDKSERIDKERLIEEKSHGLLKKVEIREGGNLYPLGAGFISVKDMSGVLHHYFCDPEDGSAAADLTLQDFDEVLVLNEECLVGQGHSHVIEMLDNIHIGSEFVLVVRRAHEEKKDVCDYIKLTAVLDTVLSEDGVDALPEGLDENQNATSSPKRDFDNVDGLWKSLKVVTIIRSVATVSLIYMERWSSCLLQPYKGGTVGSCCYYHKGQLQIAEADVDPSLAYFSAVWYAFPHAGHVKEDDKCLRIEYKNKYGNLEHLCVGKSAKELRFQKVRGSDASPESNAVFIMHPILDRAIYALESSTQQGYYLRYSSSYVYLDKISKDERNDREDIQFNILDLSNKLSTNDVPL